MALIEVKIERIGLGTGGIGYFQSKVVFIPFTMPGDLVTAQILENKKKYIRAQLVHILEPSQHRVLPPCPYFTSCGGCQWQHIPYGLQLEFKTRSVYDRLKLSAQKNKINTDLVKWNSILPSPKELRYRHRIRVHKKHNQVGFYQHKSHQLVAIEDCYLVPVELSQRFITLAQSSEYLDGNYELAVKDNQIDIVNIDTETTSFSQVNELVNIRIQEIIKTELVQIQPKHYLDLYCGTGNFTFLMHQIWSASGACGLGIEINSQSIKHARQKQQDDQISSERLSFLAIDTKELIRQPIGSTDFIFVDPPRAGLLPELIRWMGQLKANSHVMYMSCDPMTLDRDLILFYQQGFNLKQVWLFDMFAQTDHIESLVLLIKK